jgi:hypothetical protein
MRHGFFTFLADERNIVRGPALLFRALRAVAGGR